MQTTKCLPLLLITCLSLSAAKAQTETDKYPWSISLSTGISIPTGKFASKNLNDAQSGFSNAGRDQSLQAGYRFSPHFGAAVLVGYQINALDASQYKSPQAGIPGQYTIESYFDVLRFLGGLTLDYPLDKKGKWRITARGLGGVAQYSPNNIIQFFSPQDVNIIYSIHHGPAFAYQAGAGVQYRVNKYWYLLAGGDFLGSTFDVSWVANHTDNDKVTLPGYKQPVTSVNLRMGAGFRL